MNKYSFLILFFFLATTHAVVGQDLNYFFEEANSFFASSVSSNKVKYKAIKEKPEQLLKLTNFIASVDLSNASVSEKKAFYINSYNILVIKTVVDAYPINQPLDVSGFFDGIQQRVAGKKITLNNLEKKYLINEYKDARLHFALVCAAISCPPIANFAYLPKELDSQLNSRTKAAINDNIFLPYDDFSGKVEFSKIFEWYAADFKPSVIDFINKYKTKPLPKDIKLTFYTYNWTLNDSSPSNSDSSNLIKKKSNFIRIISAATLPKQTFELNLWNGLFTANYGTKEFGTRGSYFTGLYQLSYGVTGSFDVGLDFMLKSNRNNDVFESSPFRVFEFKRGSELVRPSDNLYADSDFGLTHVGPRIRWAPFKKVSLTFEQGLFLPIPSIPSGNNFDKAFYWVTQIYYNHEFNTKFGAFVALTFWQPIIPNETFKFNVPYLKFFFSWYATKRFTLYVTTTTFVEWGLGAKFLITPNFEIQFLYTYYAPIPKLAEIYVGTATNVMTFNLGIRYRLPIVSKKR